MPVVLEEKENVMLNKTELNEETKTPEGFKPIPTRISLPDPALVSDSKVAHAAAVRNVVLQIMVEAFDLYTTESMWLSYHLDKLFAPLLTQLPHTVPLAVRQEMLNGTYSRLLELRNRAKMLRGQVTYDSNVLQASAEEWTEALISPIISCYSLRPLTESSMRGQMLGLLKELGVGNLDNPRGATFLPSDLRLQVLANRSKN